MKKQFLLITLALSATLFAQAADPAYSGPQVGEKTTPFPVLDLWGSHEGMKRDPITENNGAPTAFVFINGIERSLVPLLRIIDKYGAERADRIKTEVIFLFADRVQGEQKIKAAANSLQLRARVGLSLDGAEGPGNYGLNKECMMTILTAKDNSVTANFALVQPGITDAPKVIEALARTCGDPAPPTLEQLSERAGGGREMAPRAAARAQRGEEGRMSATRGESVDFSKLDLSSEAGLRDAVRLLIGEVQRLRAEVNELRGEPQSAEQKPPPTRDPFPGAVPDDPKLNSLLRQVIRPNNDKETVDKLVAEMEAYVRGNKELTKQAADGWVRVLHFGDRYGTPHAREMGQAFLERAKADKSP